MISPVTWSELPAPHIEYRAGAHEHSWLQIVWKWRHCNHYVNSLIQLAWAQAFSTFTASRRDSLAQNHRKPCDRIGVWRRRVTNKFVDAPDNRGTRSRLLMLAKGSGWRPIWAFLLEHVETCAFFYMDEVIADDIAREAIWTTGWYKSRLKRRHPTLFSS